jgi:hypothetical protein
MLMRSVGSRLFFFRPFFVLFSFRRLHRRYRVIAYSFSGSRGIDYLFILGGRGLTGELYTKQKCFYFQLKLIPSTYSLIVLSGLDFEGGV